MVRKYPAELKIDAFVKAVIPAPAGIQNQPRY